MKKFAKYASATALITPLVISAPMVSNVAAVHPSFDDWLNQQLNNDLEVGQRTALDLADYFDDLSHLDLMIFNHNSEIADVSIMDEQMVINGKRAGSTMIDLLIHHSEDPPMNERFRLEVKPADGLVDVQDDGLGIDDIVRYIATHPHKTFDQDNIAHLLAHIPAMTPVANRPPIVSYEPFSLTVPNGESVSINLNDFFYDPDGDQLTFDVDYDSGAISVALTSDTMIISGTELSELERIWVTASDGKSQQGVMKEFHVVVEEASDDEDDGEGEAPQALYDHIVMNIPLGTELEMDLLSLFANEEEPIHISSVDGKSQWFSTPSYLLGDFYEDTNKYRVIPSGQSDAGDMIEPTTLSVDFQAENEAGLVSEQVNVTVALLPVMIEPVTVQAGSELDLKPILEQAFATYKLGNVEYGYEVSFILHQQSDWARVAPDQDDILEIDPHAHGTKYIELQALAMNGSVVLKMYIVIEIVNNDG